MFALMDRMVTIDHNNCNNCNSRNGCTANNVYCFIGYYGCNCFNSHNSCNDHNNSNIHNDNDHVNMMGSAYMSDAIL